MSDVLQACCARLMEHFDSVRIVCTEHDAAGVTHHWTWGGGNWYAQKASVQEWLLKADQDSRTEFDVVKRQHMEQDENDPD